MNIEKKGQLGELSTSIIALVVAIVILVMGVIILQEIRDTPTVSAALSVNNTNETITTVTEAGDNLARTECGVACTIVTVQNRTGANVISSGNYTTSNSGCTVVSRASVPFNNSDWNVTYSFTYGDTACITANESVVAVGDFSDFIPIIVIALAASLIIGLILVGFAFNQRER